MKEDNPMHKEENIEKMVDTRKNNGTYEEQSRIMKEKSKNGELPIQKDPELRNKISENMRNSEKMIEQRRRLAEERREKTSKKHGFQNYEESVKIIGNLHENEKFTYREIKEKFGVSNGFVQKRIKDYRKNYSNNHKVKSVKFIGYDDVYDFTVDRHHNFALSAGVFVHNCFGERQHPEKFIPIVMRKVLNGEKVIIHSDPTKTIPGSRHWIHCRNISDAFLFLFQNFEPREKFNVVGEELNNLELAKIIADEIGKPLDYELVDFHSSRPGHDLRYSLDGSKMKSMGWEPPVDLENSLRKTVRWTLENRK